MLITPLLLGAVADPFEAGDLPLVPVFAVSFARP